MAPPALYSRHENQSTRNRFDRGATKATGDAGALARTVEQQTALRCRIILGAGAGASNQSLARSLNINRTRSRLGGSVLSKEVWQDSRTRFVPGDRLAW